MFPKRSLKFKLMTLGVILSVGPLAVVAVTTQYQNRHTSQAAAQGLTGLADEGLHNTVAGIQTMLTIQDEILRETVRNSMKVARRMLPVFGDVQNDLVDKVAWNAVNEQTGEVHPISLPRLLVGGTWFGQNTASNIPTPLVDDITLLVGGSCTVFQRMNEQGDMLRVATTLTNPDETRAIGSYLPAAGRDGKPSAVVTAMLDRKAFHGRVFEIGDWHISSFEPLFDNNGEVIGALQVGIRQESTPTLRKALMQIKIGTSGYVWVLDSSGRYVISRGGGRDGESIMDERDAAGRPFIREMVERALASGEGEIFDSVYPWKSEGDGEARVKITKVTYFRPWDWIIGAGTFEDEFFAARDTIAARSREGMRFLLLILGVSVAAALVVWAVMAGRIGRKLAGFAARMQGASNEVATAAAEVSSASQSLAEGASEQAAGIEETSASLEEIAASTRQNADHAKAADALMKEANATIAAANRTMERMTASMTAISQTGEQTQKIVKTIDEIAFQTNLLALNAAVEAARAGEAGAGFAVVADEVRNLAMRAAEAARNTSSLIAESVRQISEGADLAEGTNNAFSEVAGQTGKVTHLIGEIAAASTEQAQGIGQVNGAVGEMDRIVQQNAATAEESASASEEMSAQAAHMKTMVQDLAGYLEGAGRTAAAAGDAGPERSDGRRAIRRRPDPDPKSASPEGI